jgi:hypothetical protein
LGPNACPYREESFGKKIIERSIKHNKILTTGEPGQHPTTGSGAGKSGARSTAEPEEVMMIEET